MNTSVHLKDPELGSRFRNWARQRLQLAFSRYGRDVIGVDITLSDENGPRGGVDKRCALALNTRNFGRLTFVTVGENARQALVQALRRARTLLHRRLELQRDRRRSEIFT